MEFIWFAIGRFLTSPRSAAVLALALVQGHSAILLDKIFLRDASLLLAKKYFWKNQRVFFHPRVTIRIVCPFQHSLFVVFGDTNEVFSV